MRRILLTFLVAIATGGYSHAQTTAQQQATINQLQSRITQLEAKVAALQNSSVQKLAPFVVVDPNPQNGVRGPNIVIHDANVHITSGTFHTEIVNGLGNLIIGYDEIGSNAADLLNTGDRGGSCNLVIGPYNKFSSNAYGGIVSGQANQLLQYGSVLLGGSANHVTAALAAAIGGSSNTVAGVVSVGGGGYDCTINQAYSTLWGGCITTDAGAQQFQAAFGTIHNP